MHISALEQELNKVIWQMNEAYNVLELYDLVYLNSSNHFAHMRYPYVNRSQ